MIRLWFVNLAETRWVIEVPAASACKGARQSIDETMSQHGRSSLIESAAQLQYLLRFEAEGTC